jgi:hypothetical protein
MLLGASKIQREGAANPALRSLGTPSRNLDRAAGRFARVSPFGYCGGTMARSMRVLGFRIGLGAAFVTALLPVLVALLHLLPPAIHAEPKEHHHHAAHVGLVHGQAHAAAEYQAPDTSRDGESRSKIGHCPLCFWLQGSHALPPPDTIAAPAAVATAIALPWHEPTFVAIRLSITAQPRAPPVSLPA